ncbi:MAG: ABC transporter substrate-binding protein [Chloroflexota bacterium]
MASISHSHRTRLSCTAFLVGVKRLWLALAVKLEYANAVYRMGIARYRQGTMAAARHAGVSQQTLGSDGIISSDLWRVAGNLANGIHVVSYFHPEDDRPQIQQFVQAFEECYGTRPDVWAAQVCNAIELLAYAIETAGTLNSQKVAALLRGAMDWPGVTGPHTFDAKGDVTSKPVILTVA